MFPGYSREYLNAVVLTVFEKNQRLYGFNPSEFVYSDNSGSLWVATGVSLQNIYAQLHLPWNKKAPPYPMQILYQSVPSNYVYIATSDAHVVANEYDPDTGEFPIEGWLDRTPPTPCIPYHTVTVGRYTNAAVSGPILFYGCYNQDAFAPDMKPYSCANLYRYDVSADNPEWALVLSIPGARHMHSVEPDPNDPTKIYAVAGDGGTHGLWYSPDSGVSFQHVSGWVLMPGTDNPVPNTDAGSRYGIDTAFLPPTTLFIEADGPCCTTQKAMILAFDRSNMPAFGLLHDSTLQLTDPPAEPGAPPWLGSSYGIIVTTNQTLFFLSSGENGGIGLRDGVWMSKKPDYSVPILLEDLTPPVIGIDPPSSHAGQVVTVTTTAERDWNNTSVVFAYYTDPVNQTGYTQFPSQGSFPVNAVLGNKTQFQFTFPGPGNLPPVVGGVAKLVTGWNFVKTVEQGGYLFNGPCRITLPK